MLIRFLLLPFLMAAVTVAASGQASDSARIEFFEKQIRPLLVEHCQVCHGPRLQQGGLRLDSAEFLRQGGRSGPAVVPGEVDRSRLIQLVRGAGDLQMPPTGPLSESRIAALEQWVRDGAVWPQPRPVRKQTMERQSGVVARSPADGELAAELQVWLKADAIQFKEDETLKVWQDASGRGNHWKIAAAEELPEEAAAPEWIAESRVHGKPALRFEGRSRLLGPDVLLAKGSDAAGTVFAVARFEPGDGTGGAEGSGAAPGGKRPWVIARIRRPETANGAVGYYLNGKESQVSPAVQALLNQVAAGRISFRGDLAEVILYDSARTEAERQSVEAYLGQKYDILLPWNPVETVAEFTEEEKSFWAFQPVTFTEPPEVEDRAWPRTWLDRFILAGLEARGLRPAPPADRRRLIRRLYFNLLGLPPEPGEVEAFVNDPSPQAYSNLVERLLDSPHYGERWARHWLDVVRYADTTAHDGNYIMRYAYRYRDYVVRAFNQDKPYDRFILEQLAGDLLSGDADWRAFRDRMVATGFLVLGPKALAEQDKKKFILDVADEQIDVTGRTFLGLTLACSRCHDHKFDPIPTADYYSLAAIFKGTRTMADLEFASKWQEWPLMSELRKHYPDRFPAPVPSLAPLGEASQSSTRCEATADKAIDGVFNNRQETDEGDANPWWEVKLAESGPIGMVVLWNRVDAEFKRLSNFRVSVLTDQRQEVWNQAFFPEGPDAEEFPTPAEGFRICPPRGTTGRIVRVELLGPREEETSTLHMAEVEVFAAGDCSRPPPDPLTVMAVKDGGPAPMRILVRGNHHNPGKLVPRRFLQILDRGRNGIVDSDQSGRLELARFIASPDNPLTARVMVNRIWQWHFGTGLVASSANFGTLGERPSHPELLDRLAAYFVESGWSVKQLHRLILNSSVYRMQSGVSNPAAEVADAGNRLLWRFPRRRLEAEALRDAILALSGRLDRTMGGSIFDYKGKSAVDDYYRGLFSAGKGGYGFDAYRSGRRSLYLPVVRNQIFPMFQLFDFAGSNAVTSRRGDSTVAPQALFLLNSPFVVEQARHFAEALLSGEGADDRERVDLAHRRVLARPPSDEETEQALAFLAAYPQTQGPGEVEGTEGLQEAWASYCQLLFGLNEFMYIE